MGSSSTSSIHKSFKYDVFLSFRGEDTRKNFVDHLYHALQEKSIHTYKDDERINKGKRISDEIIASIEDSKYFIIVFSKNYASSSWCLDELVKIMECHKTTGHTAYPVFYDVEPSEVRKQCGVVGEAFAKHEKREAARKWREALKEAADLAGWELKNTTDGHEAKFIQTIVEEVSIKLRSINYRFDENLVSMETRIKDIVSSLETATRDIRMIGIRGIGGGGKTTLARAVFNRISYQYEAKSFIENVREVSNASLSGLKSLQKKVLSDLLNNQGIKIGSEHEMNKMLWRIMHGRKVLLVLDDVDHIDQLEALAGGPKWFKTGSLIIITTREKQVLVAHGVKLIHNVNLLSDKEAICLFNRYAFGREIPKGYEELSEQVICYAAGLPLTIKVLGSFLCGKSKLEWVDALERLKTIPLEETRKKLELSYISLDDDHKEIFLDVATMLKGWSEDSVVEALESRGFHARIGLRVLEQKSLITIDDYERVGMHDHLEEMAKNIVRRSHPDMPKKHSRLWDSEEIEDILTNDLGTEAIRCIHFDWGDLDLEIIMKGLRNMKELRFLDVSLQLYYYWNRQINKPIPTFLNILVDVFRNWKHNIYGPSFPDGLRYLRWNDYPRTSLPKTFQANNLVSLHMVDSRIVQLWEGGERKVAIKVLKKLRFLDLSYSMLKTLDLGLTPNLETLTLRGCSNLARLHMSTECPKLRSLKLSDSKLRMLDLRMTPNLENLDLNGDLVEVCMPHECLKLKSLKFSGSKLRKLDLQLTPNLENLDLNGDLVENFMPHECLKLRSLKFYGSKLRTLDLQLTPNLENLDLNGDLVELYMPGECLTLRSLKLSCSNLRTLDLRLTPNLEKLDLNKCKSLVEIHAPIRCLKNIVYLDLSGCLKFTCFLFHIKHGSSCSADESLEVGSLAELHFTLERCPIHPSNNLPKFQFACFLKEDLPSLTINIEKLISVGPCVCTKLEAFREAFVGYNVKESLN